MSSWVIDLSRGDSPGVDNCDVCIIGSGPVGLCMARSLAESGHRVVILERGPRRAQRQANSADVLFDRAPYVGATLGRAFGAGGTSTLWGGQLLPLRESDLLRRWSTKAPPWPLNHGELKLHFSQLEQWFKVTSGSFELKTAVPEHPLSCLQWGDWAPRLSKWLPFGRRNVFDAFRGAIGATHRVRMYLNATGEEWQTQAADNLHRVLGITAKSPQGQAVQVRAHHYVICAGALESARCVLDLNEACDGLTTGVNKLAGRYLHDHLSMRVAQVHVQDYAEFQRLFAPSFVGNTMRSLRMELSDQSLRRSELPSLYAHFLFEAPADSPFAVMRDLFRAVQSGQLANLGPAARRATRALPGLVRMAIDRYLRRRLSFPRGAAIYLQCDFEQAPLLENKVYVTSKVRGTHGMLHVDWDPGKDAVGVGTAVQSAFDAFWRANRLDRVARIEHLDLTNKQVFSLSNIHDLYHPAGTTRMSKNPGEGVVDCDLLIHGTHNAFVAGGAVFPSIGAANPTFTAMALALRLAGLLHRKLTNG